MINNISKQDTFDILKKTYCRIRPSKIGGVGVFAIRDIPKGVDPFQNLIENDWKQFNIKELNKLDPEILKMIDDFFVIEEDGNVLIPDFGLNGINISFFLNHSKNPNVKQMENEEQGDSFFITLREIKKDEEITSDYGAYDNKWK